MTRTKPSKERSRSEPLPLTVNGWQLFAHPLFTTQLSTLVAAVESDRSKSPKTYRQSANFRLLAALHRLVFQEVPEDPSREKYRQGDTLGKANKHWFRVKFGQGRFRLFFRFSSSARIIIYAWVNDENSLRTYGAKTDAYAVFKKMLGKGNPPTDWNALLSQCEQKTLSPFRALLRTFGGS